jgi:hypothetical protein
MRRLHFLLRPSTGDDYVLPLVRGKFGVAMSAWLIIALVSIASMPAAFHMARARGRSTYMWLDAAMIFGPLALLALLILGKRRASKTGRASN